MRSTSAKRVASGKTWLKIFVFFGGGVVNWRRKVWFVPADFLQSFVAIAHDSALTGKWHDDKIYLLLILLFYHGSTSSLRSDTQLTSLRDFFFQVSFLKHKLFLPIKPNSNNIFVKRNNELFFFVSSFLNFICFHVTSDVARTYSPHSDFCWLAHCSKTSLFYQTATN